MNCAVDLHMHSCLSPCGDELMTPNNLSKMSTLKGLDLIALTDHNTARQLPATAKVCGELGLGLLPGMEITTREEVHLLAYFRTVEEAWFFRLPVSPFAPIPNRPDYFGHQWIMDERMRSSKKRKKLLISAVDLSIDSLAREIIRRGGLAIPAHINPGQQRHPVGAQPSPSRNSPAWR